MHDDHESQWFTRRTFIAGAGAAAISGGVDSAFAQGGGTAPNSTSASGADDASLRAAWQRFCNDLAAAGECAFKQYNPSTPLHRADAFRFCGPNHAGTTWWFCVDGYWSSAETRTLSSPRATGRRPRAGDEVR